MRKIITSLFIITLFSLLFTNCNSDRKSSKKTPPAEKYELIWADEFDKDGLPNSQNWSYDVGDGCPNLCGWGNNELEFYTKEKLKNCRIENGHLIIEAHKEKMEKREYTSARLVSRGKQEFKYGKFEFKAKLPKGLGTWPAIWMLPDNMSDHGGWPLCGEIDIMEHVGYARDSIYGTIHTQAYNHMKGTQKGGNMYLPDAEDAFHIYTLEWTKDKMIWAIDENEYFSFENENKGVEAWPFDKPFHFIFNIAVGGNWGGKHGVDDSVFPQKLEIDYVRVYKKNS